MSERDGYSITTRWIRQSSVTLAYHSIDHNCLFCWLGGLQFSLLYCLQMKYTLHWGTSSVEICRSETGIRAHLSDMGTYRTVFKIKRAEKWFERFVSFKSSLDVMFRYQFTPGLIFYFAAIWESEAEKGYSHTCTTY